MSAGTGPTRVFAHLGLLYADADDLVATVAPTLRAAVEAGDAVRTVVDRRTDRALRDALADLRVGTGALVSRSPAEVLRAGTDGLARELRTLGPGGRSGRTTLLTQYQDSTRPDDLRFWEDACSLVADDLPVTLVCACPREADALAMEAAVEGHPHLLAPGGTRENPHYRRPPDRSPTPASLWGRRSLRLHFAGREDLARVRERIARVAGDIGLGADERDAAVLAVHEAALLAVRDAERRIRRGAGRAGTDGGACTLEVRTDGRTMLTEVQAPGPGDDDDARGDGSTPLRYVEMFCAASAVRDDSAGRAVRVLSSAGPSGAGDGVAARPGS